MFDTKTKATSPSLRELVSVDFIIVIIDNELYIKKEIKRSIEYGSDTEFSVDHTKIVPGIFISRQDSVGGEIVTTYDVRVTRPNIEPAIDVAAMHSLEHIVATFLRNDPDWKDEVIYWGPMGCLTGFYLILKGARKPQEICDLMLRAFRSVADAEDVPEASPVNCGNYRMHNPEMAKWYADRFADHLSENADDPAMYEYPKSERLVTEDGKQFYDS